MMLIVDYTPRIVMIVNY